MGVGGGAGGELFDDLEIVAFEFQDAVDTVGNRESRCIFLQTPWHQSQVLRSVFLRLARPLREASGQDCDLEAGHASEVGFVVGADENGEAQGAGGGGYGHVVLRDELAEFGEFGEDIRVVFGDERGEVLDASNASDCFESSQATGGAGCIGCQSDADQCLGPHDGWHGIGLGRVE